MGHREERLLEPFEVAREPDARYRHLLEVFHAVREADRYSPAAPTFIDRRFQLMLDQGLIDEVRSLMQRPGLAATSSSMRAVGYRQVWEYVAGDCSLDEARYRALVATRQLAKRQLTWLRAEQDTHCFDPLEGDVLEPISTTLATELC